MTIGDRLGRLGLLAPSARDAVDPRADQRLGIITEGPDQPVTALSGGNQQKVVMGRALATDPWVLVLMDPTAGVDVKSKRGAAGRRRCEPGPRGGGPGRLRRAGGSADLRPGAGDASGGFVAEHRAGWTDEALVASIEGVALGHE